MKKHLFLKSLLIAIGLLVTGLTTSVFADGVYIQFKGWWANGYSDGERAFVQHDNGNGGWSWYATTDLGGGASDHWYYYELPSGITAFDIGRGTSTSNIHNSVYNNNQGAGIYWKDGDNALGRHTSYTAGHQDGNNDHWLKIYVDDGTKEVYSKSNPNYGVPENKPTVGVFLKEFGGWTWKHNNKNSTYGNVGRLTLHYKLVLNGTGDISDWHSTYTGDVSAQNESDNVKYQCWKWDSDLDLLANVTTKKNLHSGRYYFEYYYTILANRATGYACHETVYYSNSGSNYKFWFTIPAPQVTISGRPYAGIESIVTAAPKSGTTISGQTFQYQFERGHDDSWSVVQAYSSTATYTYTPSSTSDNIRVKMKVVETNEESAYATQDVYEQYYIYVEDTRDWGQMWEHMENTDNHTTYLNRSFAGEKLMACDTIDDKPIYRVTLDSYFHRLWMSVGGNSKQTYNDGFPINFDLYTGAVITTYGIKKEHAGHWYQIVTDDNENNCYLKDYPTAIFRVVSYDGATGKTYYSNAISPTEGTGTISFFANPANGSSYVKIQTWDEGDDEGGADNLDGTWNTAGTDYISGCSAVSATGTVFTATLSSSSLTGFAKYTGDYDIHVYANTQNNLDGGVAKGGVGTKFTYFEPNTTIFGTEDFNHYWVDWFPTGQDISCVGTVGNKYNSDLAGVISTDPYSPDGQIKSANGGNVRFAYNPSTNYFKRTIIAGSGSEIKIQGTYVNANGAGMGVKSSFSDASAWVYTAAAVIKGQATATITTSYNGYAQTLADNKKLMGGDSDDTYDVLITYDFKTNRLLAAWEPEGAFEGFNLESNLIVVRTEDGAPTLLNMVDGEDAGSDVTDLSGITKIYVAMELLRDSWTNKDSESPAPYATRRIDAGSYCDEYYWISLPYDCNIRDIFGIEGYGTSWIIQTYHGDYRARDGWWAETDSWWYDMDYETGIMKANQGYVLRVTNLNGDHGDTRRFASETGAKLYLYFPSSSNNLTLEEKGDATTTTVPEHKCEIWRGKETNEHAGDPNYDRRVIDSNWNIIGSPSFNTAKITDGSWTTTDPYPSSGDQLLPEKTTLKYFYEWEVKTGVGTYSPVDAKDYEFVATHAYLAQYQGTINWAPVTSNPLVGLQAPKRTNEENEDQTLKLVLMNDTVQADVTYISRMAEGATEDYDLNLDLSKLISKTGNNLYTFAGYYKMAGNCLPETVSKVRVGVQLATAGEYTFTMPEGTNGIGVTLVDKIADTRTNLALTDYTVALEAGKCNERFELEFSPIHPILTGVENIGDSKDSNIRKVMVDGIMYILRDGKVYDAQGNRVK